MKPSTEKARILATGEVTEVLVWTCLDRTDLFSIADRLYSNFDKTKFYKKDEVEILHRDHNLKTLYGTLARNFNNEVVFYPEEQPSYYHDSFKRGIMFDPSLYPKNIDIDGTPLNVRVVVETKPRKANAYLAVDYDKEFLFNTKPVIRKRYPAYDYWCDGSGKVGNILPKGSALLLTDKEFSKTLDSIDVNIQITPME